MLHASAPLRALLLLVVFSATIFAQNFSVNHSKIRRAVETGNYAEAVAELQNLERIDKKIFALNNYDYLLARMAEKQGDYANAVAKYEAVVKRRSILTEYALSHLAQIARSSGNLMLERNYLRELLTVAPASLLKNSAAERIWRSNFESKDFNSVINGEWRAGASVDSNKTTPAPNQKATIEDREISVYLAQSYLQLGKKDEAREIFSKLVTNLPNATQPDDFALAGVRGLDEIESFNKTAPQLSDGEHYRRAFIYQFNRDFPDARKHYAAIVENFPQSAFAPDAMYQIGRGYVQEGDFEKAIIWFERVLSEFSNQPIARDALSQAAAAYSRVNKPREAVARYQKYIEKYPDAENLDRAYLNIIDIKRDAGDETDALNWAAKTRETFKGKLAEAQAVFVQARIYIARNDWTNTLNSLNELQAFADLGGTRVPGGTNSAEVTFLKGFALENLARYSEAIEVYLSIPDGRNEYYGWRATERLRAMSLNEKSATTIENKLSELLKTINETGDSRSLKQMQSAFRLSNNPELQPSLLQKIQNSYATLSAGNPAGYKIPNLKLLEFGRKEILQEIKTDQNSYHQTLADELLFLGLYDEGTLELETALREKLTKNTNSLSDFPADTAFTLAVFYNRGDLANRAIVYLEPLWRNVPADYQIELIPREQLEILYPAPYKDSLIQFSEARRLDPRFTLSIMRQESRYQPNVKSNAAARGLMQFISTTSDKLAIELGKTNFRQDELYNPPTAILFGSQYLANLFAQFPNQPQAVAAAYNGGEINVARWMARAKTDDADRYVPEILFTQSKDYVYKVMANYRVYQILYDEKLNRRGN